MMRRQDGQAAVLAVVMLTALLGMAALVLDVGAWFRAQRETQAAADAAALAAAQALPEDPGTATALASQYANKNGGGLAADEIAITTGVVPNDTVAIHVTRTAPGFFSKLFGVESVAVGARALARSGNPSEARWAAPIAVDEKHPYLGGPGKLPRFDEPTQLDFEKVGPGAFRLLNLDDSKGGTGPQTLNEWILRGYDGYMPLDWYYSDPGFKPSSSWVKSALAERIGTELLFPVYRGTRAQGAGFDYEIVGWVGFHLTDWQVRGSKDGKLFGWFTRVVWEGIQSESASGPDFGVRSISLVE